MAFTCSLGSCKGCERSGATRRFPESESPSAFWANLANGVDMVTENNRRWPVGLHGTPGRFGKLLEYVNFDATFFSVHGKQASVRAPPLQPLRPQLNMPACLGAQTGLQYRCHAAQLICMQCATTTDRAPMR
jgi:hypothetical protein